MRNLHRFPYWHPDHLGEPLPESEHATSVAMPSWDSVVGYEEGDSHIIDRLRGGYPRFKLHPAVSTLVAFYSRLLPANTWSVLPFPSLETARRCILFVARQAGVSARLLETDDGIFPVAVPPEGKQAILLFWQHCGEIVSSRQAVKVLQRVPKTNRGTLARRTLEARISSLAGVPGAPVWLCPTGMAAITQIHRVITNLKPGLKTIQFGFPYVDTLRLQEKFGAGVFFFPRGDRAALDATQRLVAQGEAAAVFCECPTNPLLETPDLIELARICRKAGIPLVVDNTLDSFNNLDVVPHADVVVTSLTKFFSGNGDVMGGSILVNEQSPLYHALTCGMDDDFEDLLWDDDALALEHNSRNFLERMQKINNNALALVSRLREDSRVARIYYPENQLLFRKLQKVDNQGFGGLFSIVLHHAEQTAAAFYDALRINKGPSLGTSFSLACPYTLLAHYAELDWAESCGISRNLIRVSVGEEGDLWSRFDEALDHAWDTCRAAV